MLLLLLLLLLMMMMMMMMMVADSYDRVLLPPLTFPPVPSTLVPSC
jgi:hypothetical protein